MVQHEVLTLTFLAKNNEYRKLVVKKPVRQLEGKFVSHIMDQIIALGVLDGVREKKSAEYIQTVSKSIHL